MMRVLTSSRSWVACGVAVLAVALHAERGVLVVNVASPQGKPIPRVVLSTKGDGSVGPPTDDTGRTRIRLAAQTQPEAIVALTIVQAPKDLVFISPWDQQIRVPSFENESQNFTAVVLAERGDRDLLVSGKALLALVSKLNLAGAARGAAEASPREHRANALKETADAFGLKPEEVDTAIREWGSRTTDPYEKGMAALYAENFPVAEESLAAALKIRMERLDREKRDAADAAFFLGSAKYAQGKYRESADAYRESLELRPDDPAAMNNLGSSLSYLGDYTHAEPLLQRTIAATELARGRDDPDLVFPLNNLAGLLLMKGDTEAAEPLLRRGLAIRDAKLGPDDPRTASSLTNVASFLLSRGDDSGAEPLLLRAKRIFERATPTGSEPVPPPRPMEQRAIIAGDRLTMGRPGLAAVLLDLSTLELHRGHADSAMQLADQAVLIQTSSLGRNNPEVANGVQGLAAAELLQKNYSMAEIHFRQAVEILEATFGADHPALVAPLTGLGDVKAAEKDKAKAIDAYQRALQIRQARFGVTDKIAAGLSAKLAAVAKDEPPQP